MSGVGDTSRKNCSVCPATFKTPQGRGGHEHRIHGIKGEDPHVNIVVRCPHCDYTLCVSSSPTVNFYDVFRHMIERHFDIAYAALVKNI